MVAVATPLKAAEEAGTEPGRPAADVGVAAEVDGRKEEEDEEADKEGKGSTGVAAVVGPVEASDSLAMAASRDETEVAARAPIDGEGDCEGESEETGRDGLPPTFNGDCGADWLDNVAE